MLRLLPQIRGGGKLPGFLRSFSAATEKDYYAILGIPDSANDQEIKEAYR